MDCRTSPLAKSCSQFRPIQKVRLAPFFEAVTLSRRMGCGKGATHHRNSNEHMLHGG